MICKIKEVKNKLIEESYNKGMKELNEFFDIDWKSNLFPMVCILNNRKEMDLFYGEKTENWILAFIKPKVNVIYILDHDKIKYESNRETISDSEYYSFIKHELCHIFFNIIANGNWKPLWLSEGTAVYLSEQLKYLKDVKKIERCIESYDKIDNFPFYTYAVGGMAVKLLIENFGKEKLLNLISRSGEAKDKEDFAKLFKEIYDFDLNYENFNNLLNKK